MTSDRDLARWRIRDQHLAAPHAASASDVVASLLAVQAENPGQAAWAVATRTTRPDPGDLDGLLDTGAVIRTHVLRPTWHFVARADLGWLQELTAPRVRPVYWRQLVDQHGWTAQDLERALAGVVESLTARPDQTREQLRQDLRDRGIVVTGQPLMLLLGLAETDRLVCSGRPLDGTHTYALFADRVGTDTRFDRDQALADLAARYFTGHGPATARDLAYWATLSLGDVRRGLDAARHLLASFEHDGRTFWHAPDTAAPRGDQRPAGHLLQILDETYRGYQDSRWVLDAEGIVPRGRETAIGMAIVDAQLVGRMRRRIGARVAFEVTPHRPLRPVELDALEAAAARYGEFLGLDHELVLPA
ncbi:winged helix DNA-binding domain-containing protein [Nocardioides pantholopis]|uniref:winged helix DNA-binding domain-containing protein n=1 Tax=Nocardioides pantholopis TaxID=2483798 RepID=UPI0013DE03A6|nr:winged helix DNA-binding domain-containing protein [Nocardioides pantholopis]